MKKILVVDDDAVFVESVRDLLEACGYVVLTASDGSEGLKMAFETKPDLMLLDVMMATETEGFHVARRIAHAPELKETRVFLVTGIVNTTGFPGALLYPSKTYLPVDRILNKPIEPERLLAEVENALLTNKEVNGHEEPKNDPDC